MTTIYIRATVDRRIIDAEDTLGAMDDQASPTASVTANVFMKVQMFGTAVFLVGGLLLAFLPLHVGTQLHVLGIFMIIAGAWSGLWVWFVISFSLRRADHVLHWRALLRRGQIPVGSIERIYATRAAPYQGNIKLIRFKSATGSALIMESADTRSFAEAAAAENPNIRLEPWWKQNG